jgi:hypothetical protein
MLSDKRWETYLIFESRSKINVYAGIKSQSSHCDFDVGLIVLLSGNEKFLNSNSGSAFAYPVERVLSGPLNFNAGKNWAPKGMGPGFEEPFHMIIVIPG